MSTELITILMFVGVFIGIFTGFPIAFVLGTLGIFFGLIALPIKQLVFMVPLRVIDVLSTEVFAAAPLFIFMGVMVEKSKIADSAYAVMHKLMGPLRGGLALTTILLCTLFAAATGIIGASVITMGLLAIPAMLKRGYNKELALGTVAASGTLGMLIPPSLMLIFYAPMAGVSVVDMFAGAIFPGLLLSGLYAVYVIVRCYLYPNDGPALPAKEREEIVLNKVIFEALKSLFPFVVLILAVLGSIFFGIAAPTEAAAMGALGSLVLSAFYRKLSWSVLSEAAAFCLKVSVMVIFIALGANLFTGTFLSVGCGNVVSSFLMGLGIGPWGILFLLLSVVFLLGMFIDWIGILFIMVPIFGPIITGLGFDPLWVGLVICVSLQISFLTPPFAYAIFYLKGLSFEGVKYGDIVRGVIPFVVLQVVALALVILFKPLTLWLPSLLVGR
jgi:tripartite ATP-independent transporter DctM subunit